MREILFRGKRFSDINDHYSNEWVEGYYYQLGSQHYIRKDIHIWHVDPNTVSQFTGLTDKNGVKIFEGDIYRIGQEVGFVIFKNGSFVWTGNNYPMSYKKIDFIEIIGNIHDNPELIK